MKRTLDLLLVLITLPLWLPLAIMVALIILLTMGPPVIYTSERAGKNGRPFKFYKFRTMRNGNEPDIERITRVGAILRKTSLDELPQLVHVLLGQMSLVGPRPLPTRYLPRYTTFAARRHEVLPGITGWAQVNGRNQLSWDEKFELDVWYVDHHNLGLDAKIIGLTIKNIFLATGINESKYDTMCEYKGGNS